MVQTLMHDVSDQWSRLSMVINQKDKRVHVVLQRMNKKKVQRDDHFVQAAQSLRLALCHRFHVMIFLRQTCFSIQSWWYRERLTRKRLTRIMASETLSSEKKRTKKSQEVTKRHVNNYDFELRDTSKNAIMVCDSWQAFQSWPDIHTTIL